MGDSTGGLRGRQAPGCLGAVLRPLSHLSSPLQLPRHTHPQVRFVYDGNRLDRNSTPAELDMEEGDTIDAFLEQIGGCC